MKKLIYIIFLFFQLTGIGQVDTLYNFNSDSISLSLIMVQGIQKIKVKNLHKSTMLFDTTYYNVPYKIDSLGSKTLALFSFIPPEDFHTTLNLYELEKDSIVSITLSGEDSISSYEEFMIEINYICADDFEFEKKKEEVIRFSSLLFLDKSRYFSFSFRMRKSLNGK